MERRKIRRPETAQTPESLHPTRRQSVMPTGLRHPEMVQPANPKPEIAETPVPVSQLHTEEKKSRQRFDQTHSRITVYLTNSNLEHVRRLYDEGTISTLTALFNDAIQAYLSEHYGI